MLTVLPSVREIVDGRVTVGDIRDLQIEDLLGRQQVEMDAGCGRVACSTGAGPDHRGGRIDRVGDRPPGARVRTGAAVLLITTRRICST